MNKLSSVESSRRRRLWEMGWDDRQIAKAVSVSPSSICFWRKRNKLPANRGVGGFRPPNSEVRRTIWLYNEQGYSDIWIAQKTGLSKSAIHYTRTRMGLLPNNGRKWSEREEMVIAYLWAVRGLSPRQISELIPHRTKNAVHTRLARLGDRIWKLVKEADPDWVEMYLLAKTDE